MTDLCRVRYNSLSWVYCGGSIWPDWLGQVGEHFYRQKEAFFCSCMSLLSSNNAGTSITHRFLTESVNVSWTPSNVASTMSFKISNFPASIVSVLSGFRFSLFTLSHLATLVLQWLKISTASLGELVCVCGGNSIELGVSIWLTTYSGWTMVAQTETPAHKPASPTPKGSVQKIKSKVHTLTLLCLWAVTTGERSIMAQEAMKPWAGPSVHFGVNIVGFFKKQNCCAHVILYLHTKGFSGLWQCVFCPVTKCDELKQIIL